MMIITSSKSLTNVTIANANSALCRLAGKAKSLYPSIPSAANRNTYADQAVDDRIGGFERRYKSLVNMSRARRRLLSRGRCHAVHHTRHRPQLVTGAYEA